MEMTTIEALAHEIRGGMMVFCIIWCFLLYPTRQRSRMMYLLFISTLWLTISFLKDSVFVFEAIKYSIYLDNIVNLLDLTFFPLICAFFIESTRPGKPTGRQIAATLIIQLSLMLAYIVFPNEIILLCGYTVAIVMAIVTVAYVFVSAARYNKALSDNYSNIEHRDVKWVAPFSVVFFVFVIAYPILFNNTTWLSETIYDLASMIVLSILFCIAKNHIVVSLNLDNNDNKSYTETFSNEYNNDELISDQEEIPMKEEIIGKKLRKAMEQDRLYLNTDLSLREVSSAIGSNMKYVSLYLNKMLGLSFYEYVNKYRVEYACKLIHSMYESGQSPLISQDMRAVP